MSSQRRGAEVQRRGEGRWRSVHHIAHRAGRQSSRTWDRRTHHLHGCNSKAITVLYRQPRQVRCDQVDRSCHVLTGSGTSRGQAEQILTLCTASRGTAQHMPYGMALTVKAPRVAPVLTSIPSSRTNHAQQTGATYLKASRTTSWVGLVRPLAGHVPSQTCRLSVQSNRIRSDRYAFWRCLSD